MADIQEESILNASVSDQAAAEDNLGFKPYVEAIAEFLINPVTEPPLTISIEGEWGSGKSSFMKQLQKTIEEFQQKKFEKELQINSGRWQTQAETVIRKIQDSLNSYIQSRLNILRGFSEFIPLKFLGSIALKIIEFILLKIIEFISLGIIEFIALVFKIIFSLLLNIYKWILLNLNKMQPKPRIIWFNAWKHDKAEALWAAFALEFLRQVSISRLGYNILDFLKVNINLFRLRFDWKNGFQFISLALLGLGTIFILAVVAIYKGDELFQPDGEIQKIFVQVFQKPLNIPIKQIFQPPVNIPRFVFRSVVTLFSVIGVISLLLKLLNVGDPKNELAKYLKTPNYENQVAFIEKFHEDFKKIVQAYAGKSKVYVFIDDLDRCEVPKSAELMQAINMMIANDPQLIFILGMDREKVAAGIAVKYKDLIPYLSVDADHQSINISSRKGMEYGYAFLEKFIQIPFQVPQPAQSDFQRFLENISRPQKKTKNFWYSSRLNIANLLKYISQLINRQPEDKAKQEPPIQDTQTTSTPKQKILNRQEQLKLAVTEDSRNVRDIILMVAPVLDYNPRRLKQFINLFRLKTYIAANTGSFDELTDEEKTVKPLTLEKLGKFTAISLKFPRLIVDLNIDRQLLKNLQHGALKNPAAFSQYNKNTQYWGEHQKLVELLRSPAVYQPPDSESMVIEDKYSLAEVDVDKLLQVSPGTKDDLSSETGIDYTKLRNYLRNEQWKDADNETYLVMLQAFGRKDGDYLRIEELLSFPCTDLHTIDNLWVKYSNGHFGFSVQKEIYLNVGGKPDGKYYEGVWEKLGDRVGWRVKENWISYSNVIFDTSSPKGHLPFWMGIRIVTFGGNDGKNLKMYSLLSHRDL